MNPGNTSGNTNEIQYTKILPEFGATAWETRFE